MPLQSLPSPEVRAEARSWPQTDHGHPRAMDTPSETTPWSAGHARSLDCSLCDDSLISAHT